MQRKLTTTARPALGQYATSRTWLEVKEAAN
jgi:hypothetical protein